MMKITRKQLRQVINEALDLHEINGDQAAAAEQARAQLKATLVEVEGKIDKLRSALRPLRRAVDRGDDWQSLESRAAIAAQHLDALETDSGNLVAAVGAVISVEGPEELPGGHVDWEDIIPGLRRPAASGL